MGSLALMVLSEEKFDFTFRENTEKKVEIVPIENLRRKYGSDRVHDIHETYLLNSELSPGYCQGYYSPETELEAITKTNLYFSIHCNLKK